MFEKKPKPKASEITYRLMSKNYDILSNQEKDDVLREFVGILASLEEKKKATLSIVNEITDIPVTGGTYEYVERSVYLTSKYDFVSRLSGSGFKFTRLDSPLKFPVGIENLKSLKLKNGLLCRAYAVYSFPRSIHPAWMVSLANLCHIVHVDFMAMNPSKARRMLATHENTMKAMMGERHKIEAAEARGVKNLLQDQEVSLFEAGITAVITGADKKSLEENCKKFETQARWRQISCMAVAGKQKTIFDGWERRFIMPSTSLAAFWPFTSSDMMAPNGVYIGKNELTNAPVIYDYTKMTNYNMTILGASGFGKSMTAKTYISNFFEMVKERYGENSNVMAYIFDLHGEYVALKDHFNMNVLDLMTNEEAGLDPFKLMASPSQAADLVSEVANMKGDRANLRSVVVSRSKDVKSIAEMVDKLQHDDTGDAELCRKAASYLLQFTNGDQARKFVGDVKIKDKTIIAMTGAEKTEMNAMMMTLALLKIWRDIRKTPVHVPKILVIEEAWFALSMESTAKILSNIARSGRKENVHMILMTQDIEEVMRNDHGSAIIKNSSTVMLLRLTPTSAKSLRNVLEMSDNEIHDITQLDKGHAILRADANRIKLSVRPSDEQMKLFDTSVQEIDASLD